MLSNKFVISSDCNFISQPSKYKIVSICVRDVTLIVTTDYKISQKKMLKTTNCYNHVFTKYFPIKIRENCQIVFLLYNFCFVIPVLKCWYICSFTENTVTIKWLN